MTEHASIIADIPRLSDDEARFVRRILDRVLVVGRASYSPWVAANETRDMLAEAADESLDRAIYGAMYDVMRADGFVLPTPSSSWTCTDGEVRRNV